MTFLCSTSGQQRGIFVIRHKHNLSNESLEERELPEDTVQHILKDEIIQLANPASKEKYPIKLRRVVVWDDENQQTIELITNNFRWSARTIGDLYKSRWEIKVFFRDIKQLLHIKTFIGTSRNAVMIQICIALITILMLKTMKGIAKFEWYLLGQIALPNYIYRLK